MHARGGEDGTPATSPPSPRQGSRRAEKLSELGGAPLANHARVTGFSQGPPQPCRGNLHQEEEEEKEEGVSHGPFSSTRARREERGEKREKQQNFGEKMAPQPPPHPSRRGSGPSRAREPARLSRYLLEASVLDVQLLGIDKVKELPILLPAGQAGQSGSGGDGGASSMASSLAGTARACPAARTLRPPLYAAEGVLRALLGLNLEVEGAGGGGPAGKVDEGDLVEADVHGRLVHVDEATLQWVEQP